MNDYLSVMITLGRVVLGLFLTISVLQSCETDFDLNGEWEDITVVYGLLDKNEDIHYVMINKAFLGDGNALVYAQVRDSLEYNPNDITASIDEVINGSVNRTFTLRDTVLNNKATDGIFFSPDHTVYYFRESALDENATFKLSILVALGSEVKEVRSEIELVGGFSISRPLKNAPTAPSQPQISFANSNSSLTDNYLSEGLKWTGPLTANRYESEVTLNYDEVSTSGTITPRSISWGLGTVKEDGDTEEVIEGKDFYQWVDNKIKTTPGLNNSDVMHRRFNGIDFTVVAAGEDLNTYINVNEPVTGVVQDRPEFTNIDGGIGLFSSRTSETVGFKWLNKFSFEELCEGQYTSSLKFCTDSLFYPGVNGSTVFWCP